MLTGTSGKIEINLGILVLILLVVLFIKTYLESTNYEGFNTSPSASANINIKKNITSIDNKVKDMKSSDMTGDRLLSKIIFETQRKINKAVEDGIKEGFQDQQIKTDSISYINKLPKVKLQLYYKPSCKYCKEFMPVWYKIINNLPLNANYEEINVDENRSKAFQNMISTVPTIILVVNDTKTQYYGSRSYNDIAGFLKINGVNLIERSFESFNDTDSSNNASNNSNNNTGNNTGNNASNSASNNKNPNCPAVTFDKQIDMQDDKYLYQIFNANGQFGYALGGYNEDKTLTPFQAAYSTVDSYLSSLPDDKDPTKNSFKKIDECTNIYAKNIINFGLCDNDELNKILDYNKKVKNGMAVPRFDGTNFNTNDIIVNSIKKVCNLSS